MSLLGIMMFIGYQSEMGLEKYAWKKEGNLYFPATTYLSWHRIQEQANSIYFTTTRHRSTTVINYDVQNSDADKPWKDQYPTKNVMGDDADTFRWLSLATKKQRCNVDDDTRDSCGSTSRIMSKPGKLNADQRFHSGIRLPRQETFEPLEHNLLRMIVHAVFAANASAFADTKHNKNQDDEAKTCIAHTVFACNKANRKPEEEPKQVLGLETSTRHYLNAGDSSESSMEKKVEYALFAKSALMMLMPALQLKLIFCSYLLRSGNPDRTKCTVLRYAQEVPNDELVPTFSSFFRKALQQQSTSASMVTGSLLSSCSGIMNLNRGQP
jgi:hypothetical protein